MDKSQQPRSLSLPLAEAQHLFLKLLPRLIDEITTTEGYEMSGGELWRTPEMVQLYAKSGRGVSSSVHPLRLAIDINLFKQGQYLQTSEAHRQFGLFWESLHPLTRWGGNFSKPDGNHYSVMIWDKTLGRWRA